MALKVFDRWGDNWDGTDDSKFYLKSEADLEIRKQKRKRCLANAEACKHKRWRNDEGFDFARSNRQMLKWQELAEKFKEGV